jgi:hypothetical protein
MTDPRSPEPRLPSLWELFLKWESEAARRGSGMTDEQKTGAALLRSWLVNHAPERASSSDELRAALDQIAARTDDEEVMYWVAQARTAMQRAALHVSRLDADKEGEG